MQAEGVVVGFQRNQAAPGQMLLHHRGQDAKVGGQRHRMPVRRLDAIPAAGHIVAGRERCNLKTADILGTAVHGHRVDRRGQHPAGIEHVERIGTAEHRHAVMLEEGVQPADMVGVLMGDEHAVTVRDRQTKAAERAQRCAAALALVEQQIAPPLLHDRTVAGGAGI